jgi:N-acetylmuramoyl-L-alanine amidase
MNSRTVAGVMLAASLMLAPMTAMAGPRDVYTRALERERAVRDVSRTATVDQIRAVVSAYERLVRQYPTSAYSDNALWQAANLSLLAYQKFGESADRKAGVRLLNQLKTGYPSSSLVPKVTEALAAFETTESANLVPPPLIEKTITPPPVATTGDGSRESVRDTKQPSPAVETNPGDPTTIRGISRTPLPDGVRVTIEMGREILYHREQLDNPRRLFFDLRNARPAPQLVDAALTFTDDVVREIRLGRHPQNTTRVVMDMKGVDSYSVFTLYNPFRVVVDFHRAGAAPVAADLGSLPPIAPARPATPPPEVVGVDNVEVKSSSPKGARTTSTKDSARKTATRDANDAKPVATSMTTPAPAPLEKLPLSSRETTLPAPTVPAANSNGQFSLSRQLGLGVSRVVIDAGHGGHDPGARGNGLNESELVLDVAQRLRKLLEAQPGVDVVMTRDEDVFIPLEERTAIANREGADLFLSIHANASRNVKARGIETYFLNFASNPEAEAVAARENSGSGKTMHSLPEIVRAITLNNKIDESRDFAEMVQKSMVKKLESRNAQLRDLGVRQAPFVVLIGAGMPSVLAEISFITHRQEGQLLKTPAYRQQIAEALFDAVMQYQKSLKTRRTIATREE